MRLSKKSMVGLVASAVVAMTCSAMVTTGTASAATKPVSGGSVTFLNQADNRSYDPAKQSGSVIDGVYGGLVYDELLYYTPTSSKQIAGLAVSASADSTSSVWTIKLRPNVTFTDGTAFDAAAVQAHFNRVKDPATASPSRASAAEIATMEVVDPTTLKVTLVAPDGTWDQTLATPLGAVPSPTAVAKFGALYGTSPETTVGAGPFMLTEFVVGDHHTFKRNPKYWDSPKPYLDSVTIKAIADPQTRYNTFTTGGADLTNTFTAHPTIPLLAGSYKQVDLTTSFASFGMRTDTGPTADVRVRQALVYAVDTKAVILRAAPGAEMQATWNAPGTPYYVPVKLPTYNPTKAKAALDSYLRSTGQSSVDVTLYNSETSATVAQAFQQEWAKIPGLNVTVQIDAQAASSARIAGRNYTGMINTALILTPRGSMNVLKSGSPQNLTFLSDTAIDAALISAAATSDVAAQKAQMTMIAQRLNEDLPYVPEWPAPFKWFYQKGVNGVQVTSNAAIRFQDVWKSK